MKNLIFSLILIACLNSLPTQSQQYYFNKLNPYNADTIALSSIASVDIEEGYLLAGEFAQNENYGFSIRKLNVLGEVDWIKLFPIEENVVTLIRGSALISTTDGNFVIIGTAGNTNTDNKIYVVKFSPTGELIWSNNYAMLDYNGGPTIINTKDSGFLITAFTQEVEPEQEPSQAYMIKLNSLGEVEWEQTHSQDVTVFDVLQTTAGNYLLSGYQYSSETSYDPWLLLTDSLGNQIWEKTYGTNESDGPCFIEEYTENTYIVSGSKNYNIDSNNEIFVNLLDEEGEIIWSKEFPLYEENTGCSASPLIINKEIVLVVNYYNDFSSLAPPRVRLMKLDSLGNILLDQPINANIYGDQYIRDLDACEGGGYLLTGFINNAQGGSWVVKTDSLGQTCYQVSCDSLAYATSIPSLIVKDRRITISPNPAQDQAIISYDLGDFKSAVLHLYDTQGRLVQVQSLAVRASSTHINLSRLNAGLYVYEVVADGEQIHSSSIVIK